MHAFIRFHVKIFMCLILWNFCFPFFVAKKWLCTNSVMVQTHMMISRNIFYKLWEKRIAQCLQFHEKKNQFSGFFLHSCCVLHISFIFVFRTRIWFVSNFEDMAVARIFNQSWTRSSLFKGFIKILSIFLDGA